MKRSSPLHLDIPTTETKCKACRQRDLDSMGFILDEKTASQKVEVIALENEYVNEERAYRVRARIRWKCPSCGMSITQLRSIRDIPVSVVKGTAGKCPTCGNPLELTRERIGVSSFDDYEDIIDLTGFLICTKCSKSIPFDIRVKATFRPIWEYLLTIKRIVIARDRLEFERDTTTSSRSQSGLECS